MLTNEQIKALKTTINDYEWGFSNRTKRVLENIGITGSISEVVLLTKHQLSMSKGCGSATLREIIQRLSEKGLYLEMKSEDVVKALYTDITVTSTERKVWISDLGAIKTDDNDVELTLSCPQRPHVLRKGFEFEECWNHCAWFRIKDGLAMCGDQIIGKLIEKEETKCTL